MNNEQAMDWHTMSDEQFREIMEYVIKMELLKKQHEKIIQEHNNDDDLPF